MSVSKDAIRARDQEATDDGRLHELARLPKRPRTEQAHTAHTAWKLRSLELRNMVQGDRESRTFQEIDKMHEERLPDPKFKCGQSVLWWWASWMKSAEETPKKYNRFTRRPRWYSVEVLSFEGYGTIRYAGQEVKDNLYNVCDWFGRPEVVPEAFLMAKLADVSCLPGRVIADSGLDVAPNFWEHFITRNVGIGGRKINTTTTQGGKGVVYTENHQ